MSKVKATPRHYDILRDPVITEKTTMASEHNQVVFNVSSDADKPSIKEASFSPKIKKKIKEQKIAAKKDNQSMEKTQDSHKKVLNLPKAILLKKGSGLSGRKIAPKKEAKSMKNNSYYYRWSIRRLST